jgi:hypothetical protein
MTDVVNGTGGMPSVVSFSGHGHGYGYDHGYGNWDTGRTEQNQANMSIMQSIAGVEKELLASQSAQSAGLSTRIDSLKDVVTSGQMVAAQQLANVDKDLLESRYLTLQNIMQDGDKTRALIQSNYTDTLNRQLQTAQFDARFDRLCCEVDHASQSIRATNQAINFGAGTLTANPTNTNTNNRA